MNEARLDELAQTYLLREDILYKCNLCGLTGKDKSDMKMHLESKHFPTDNGYACLLCKRMFNTKRAFKSHKSKMCQ